MRQPKHRRSDIIECAMNVALEMADRSEDPFTRVGAVALTGDNRIIATAYNGLLPGYQISDLEKHLLAVPPNDFRTERLPFMVHAEQNLCSLIKRGEARHCIINICPCPSCMLLLAVCGIKKVTFLEYYHRDARAESIAKFYDLELVQYVGPCKRRVTRVNPRTSQVKK